MSVNDELQQQQQQRKDEEDEGFYMANLPERLTGLPFIVWVRERSGRERHDARIKVCIGSRWKDEDQVNVALRPQPHITDGKMTAAQWARLKEWIDKNYEILIEYWELRLDIDRFLERLKKV